MRIATMQIHSKRKEKTAKSFRDLEGEDKEGGEEEGVGRSHHIDRSY